ncbi:MAG: hypothetical protein AB7O59_25410 [Pirellulales bacterium]
MIYVALMALLFYLESTGGVDHWPTWALCVAGVACGAILIALPFLAVKYFFGLELRGRDRQFSLRKMLLGVLFISVFVWYFTQLEWLKQRRAWRSDHRAASRATSGQSPPGLLRFFGERGESRIEIENPTDEQIAEAQQLFPEATVVAAPGPDRAQKE